METKIMLKTACGCSKLTEYVVDNFPNGLHMPLFNSDNKIMTNRRVFEPINSYEIHNDLQYIVYRETV